MIVLPLTALFAAMASDYAGDASSQDAVGLAMRHRTGKDAIPLAAWGEYLLVARFQMSGGPRPYMYLELYKGEDDSFAPHFQILAHVESRILTGSLLETVSGEALAAYDFLIALYRRFGGVAGTVYFFGDLPAPEDAIAKFEAGTISGTPYLSKMSLSELRSLPHFTARYKLGERGSQMLAPHYRWYGEMAPSMWGIYRTGLEGSGTVAWLETGQHPLDLMKDYFDFGDPLPKMRARRMRPTWVNPDVIPNALEAASGRFPLDDFDGLLERWKGFLSV